MKILKFRVRNHKGFVDSGELSFSAGINIIAGKNNTGKTALLDALSLSFEGKPHLSLTSKPREESPIDPTILIDVEFSLKGETVRDWMLSNPNTMSLTLDRARRFSRTAEGYQEILRYMFSHSDVPFRLSAQKNGYSFDWVTGSESSFKLYEVEVTEYGKRASQVNIRRNKEMNNFIIESSPHSGDFNGEIGLQVIATKFRNRIYKFNAERMKIGEYKHGTETKLSSDAGNLPEVLVNLSSKQPTLFKRYNELIKSIFPEIHHIGVRPVSAERVEIFIQVDSSERSDLSFKLSECGTGLSQVLAILYVVLNEKMEHIIIIDEPNSFLHPGATKKLMGILSLFNHHQYIISSHSAEVFKSPGVSTVKLVTLSDGQTSVKSLSLEEVEQTKECLLELGIEISDLLASDSNIWVEGPTEGHCFPLILRALTKWHGFSTSFIPVRNTGDFDGKKAILTIDLYNRLTSSHLALPSKVLFLFDSEKKTETQKADLERRGTIFLPRRMFENYLIHPQAILSILNSLEYFKENKLSQNAIEKWLSENGYRYLPKAGDEKFDSSSAEHLRDVDGAKLLSDMFSDLTGATQEYYKISHGKSIVEWILKYDKDHFFATFRFSNKVFREVGRVKIWTTKNMPMFGRSSNRES